MKVLAILGSPRTSKSRTELVLDEYLRGIEENNNSFKKIILSEKKIAGCKGCNYCEFGERYCINKDDMQEIYPLIEEADYIIFATPIYWFSMTSQIKACIDRMYALGAAVWKNKKIGIISTYGGENHESSGFNMVEANFKGICDFTKADFLMSYAIAAEELDDKDSRQKHLEEIYLLGKSI